MGSWPQRGPRCLAGCPVGADSRNTHCAPHSQEGRFPGFPLLIGLSPALLHIHEYAIAFLPSPSWVWGKKPRRTVRRTWFSAAGGSPGTPQPAATLVSPSLLWEEAVLPPSQASKERMKSFLFFYGAARVNRAPCPASSWMASHHPAHDTLSPLLALYCPRHQGGGRALEGFPSLASATSTEQPQPHRSSEWGRRGHTGQVAPRVCH